MVPAGGQEIFKRLSAIVVERNGALLIAVAAAYHSALLARIPLDVCERIFPLRGAT